LAVHNPVVASFREWVQPKDRVTWRVRGESLVRRVRVDVEVGLDVLPGWFQREVIPQYRNGLLVLDLDCSERLLRPSMVGIEALDR
jgi:antibiotic biosynthesis monooxygenase (ABM) superfamily enzyme